MANKLAAMQENWSFWGYDLVRHKLVCTVMEEEQKLEILDLNELHYPFSENKGADQLCLCFRIDKILLFFFFFFFFFVFFYSVLRPFQDYFSSYETGQSVGGAKTGEPGEKPPDTPASRTLLVSHVARAGLEPTPVTAVR